MSTDFGRFEAIPSGESAGLAVRFVFGNVVYTAVSLHRIAVRCAHYALRRDGNSTPDAWIRDAENRIWRRSPKLHRNVPQAAAPFPIM